MSDIFISYKKEDKDRVAGIVQGLRAEALDVWWDQDIAPGQPWDDTIKHGIESASCIVAVWSTLSVTAPWVKEEAGHGKARGILVPVRLHDVDPPLGFGLIQAADLRYWKGDRSDRNWRDFVDTVRKVLRGEKISHLLAPQLGPRRTAGLLVSLGVAGLAVAALTVAILTSRHTAIQKPATPEEEAAWGSAVKGKARPGYEAYLARFPGGRFADDAKAALASCRPVSEARSEPFERKINVTGTTSAESFGDRQSAIQSARDRGIETAGRACEQLAAEEKVDNITARTTPVGQPMCTSMGTTATTCTQGLWVTCTGAKRIDVQRETCG